MQLLQRSGLSLRGFCRSFRSIQPSRLPPMPYTWTTVRKHPPAFSLRLWPHRSLPRQGFAAIILLAFLLISVPLFGLLGTVFMWALLPFMMLALAGLWWGLQRNYRDGTLTEVLDMTVEELHLTRQDPKGTRQEWRANPYWTELRMHKEGGPVDHYITLRGNGREVEIGAFLSEDERKRLYAEMLDCLRQLARP